MCKDGGVPSPPPWPAGGQRWDPGGGGLVVQSETPPAQHCPGVTLPRTPHPPPPPPGPGAGGQVGASCAPAVPCQVGAGPAGTSPADHPESACGNRHEPKFPRQRGGATVGQGAASPAPSAALAAASPKGPAPRWGGCAGWGRDAAGCSALHAVTPSMARPRGTQRGRIWPQGAELGCDGPGQVPGQGLTLATSSWSHRREGQTTGTHPEAGVRGSGGRWGRCPRGPGMATIPQAARSHRSPHPVTCK